MVLEDLKPVRRTGSAPPTVEDLLEIVEAENRDCNSESNTGLSGLPGEIFKKNKKDLAAGNGVGWLYRHKSVDTALLQVHDQVVMSCLSC